MSTEVVPRLFVGDIADACSFHEAGPCVVICVLNQWPWNGDPGALWVPIVVADADNLAKPIQALPGNLSLVADIAAAGLVEDRRVLVHCREGVERAPLAAAWFLWKKLGWTLDAAYSHLREIRPQVVDRRSWLP